MTPYENIDWMLAAPEKSRQNSNKKVTTYKSPKVMKTTSLISLHTKAIKTLEAIEKAERRIAANEKYLANLKAEKAPWLDYVLKHTEVRIETDKRIIDRLSSIYSNLLVRIYRVAEATNPITLNDSENGAV